MCVPRRTPAGSRGPERLRESMRLCVSVSVSRETVVRGRGKCRGKPAHLEGLHGNLCKCACVCVWVSSPCSTAAGSGTAAGTTRAAADSPRQPRCRAGSRDIIGMGDVLGLSISDVPEVRWVPVSVGIFSRRTKQRSKATKGPIVCHYVCVRACMCECACVFVFMEGEEDRQSVNV